MTQCVQHPKQMRYDPPLKSIMKNNTIPEDAILEYDKEMIKVIDDIAVVLNEYHSEGLIGKLVKWKKIKNHSNNFSKKMGIFDNLLCDENYKFALLRLMNECILPKVAFKKLIPIMKKHKINLLRDWDNIDEGWREK